MYEGGTVPARAACSEDVLRKLALGLRAALVLSAIIALAGPQVVGALAFAVFAFLTSLLMGVITGIDLYNARDLRISPNNASDALLGLMSLPLAFFFMLVFALVSGSPLGDTVSSSGFASYGAGFVFAVIGWLQALAHYWVSMQVAGRNPFSAEAFAAVSFPALPGSAGAAQQPYHQHQQFDSGTPIVPPSNNSGAQFDPHTGAPVGGAQFDPHTGAPVGGAQFDPHTGAPVGGGQFDHTHFGAPNGAASALQPGLVPAAHEPAPAIASQPVPNPTNEQTPGFGAPAGERVRFGTELAADERKKAPSALVGERVRVFDDEAGERVGTVVAVNSTFGGSTTHDIVFEGGDGSREPTLLQKGPNAGKGLRFHVLEKTGAE